MPDAKEKRLVVFYDCCIPQAQFLKIMLARLPEAYHIFVRSIFPELICRDDYALFTSLGVLHREKYVHCRCVLVTQDKKFVDEIADHPERGGAVRLLTIFSCNSVRENYRRARQLVAQLREEYSYLL